MLSLRKESFFLQFFYGSGTAKGVDFDAFNKTTTEVAQKRAPKGLSRGPQYYDAARVSSSFSAAASLSFIVLSCLSFSRPATISRCLRAMSGEGSALLPISS